VRGSTARGGGSLSRRRSGWQELLSARGDGDGDRGVGTWEAATDEWACGGGGGRRPCRLWRQVAPACLGGGGEERRLGWGRGERNARMSGESGASSLQEWGEWTVGA
jgi:hypothetical protein